MAERHNARRVASLPESGSPKPRRASKKSSPDPRAPDSGAPDSGAPLDGVFAEVDLEKTALELLKGADNRLKLQVLSLLLPYKFGKPAQCAEPTGPREPKVVRMVVEGIGE